MGTRKHQRSRARTVLRHHLQTHSDYACRQHSDTRRAEGLHAADERAFRTFHNTWQTHYEKQCVAEDGTELSAPLCKLLRLPPGTKWGENAGDDS